MAGRGVLVTGARVSGLALIAPLRDLGAEVTLADGDQGLLDAAAAEHGVGVCTPDQAVADIARFSLVVTSPGWRPDAPVLAAAAGAGIPIWGDVEFAWRLDLAEFYGPARRWLVVTGTNGKTTTTSMLESILRAAGIPAVACGNIGLPITDALRAGTRETPGTRNDVLAVELSSFQLHWAPSVHPAAGAVLNIAEDHLDWHGGMQGYVDAKARALTGEVAVLGLDDPVAAGLAGRSGVGRTVGFRLGVPTTGEFGIDGDRLVDRAFATDETLALTEEITPPGPAGLMDALAAAALARSIGVSPAAVRDGLRRYQVGPHRAALVAEVGGVAYIDDSKATNPHAARVSILAHPRVVWVAGGLLKGASVDELVAEVADRLVGAVLLGRDAAQIAAALARHAPQVPVVRVDRGHDDRVTTTDAPDAVMARAVEAAAALAGPGDTVLLAPAAASLDMFADYGHRGRSFADAVRALDRPGDAGAEPAQRPKDAGAEPAQRPKDAG
ncbi:UDP-N-acetylmuramoyl-L-alanine--D-glutamate ligase [Rhodococcus spelaei]|uniref:UDP-N-acetylmuramoylalanine--D-glutamate ligase n=1 Tax=Rhodococcus spelaei TaxID=2546320 RepID=A0A541BN96_9NOCA|nr:UDP-N-acetylmuramoyl-L-alanine--D-glutamate ligase [Rhodococcus spelaei]